MSRIVTDGADVTKKFSPSYEARLVGANGKKVTISWSNDCRYRNDSDPFCGLEFIPEGSNEALKGVYLSFAALARPYLNKNGEYVEISDDVRNFAKTLVGDCPKDFFDAIEENFKGKTLTLKVVPYLKWGTDGKLRSVPVLTFTE